MNGTINFILSEKNVNFEPDQTENNLLPHI